MTEYIKSDPLSNKAVVYDKMVWAKSKLVVLEQVRAKVDQQPQDTLNQRQKVDRELRLIDNKIGEAQREYERLLVQGRGPTPRA